MKVIKRHLSTLSLLLFALTIRWGVAEAYFIPSGSMQPTLLIHDHILVNKFVYGIRAPFSKTWLWEFKKPERGEVIVFKDPRDNSTSLIKRVIGLPGDKIAYKDRQLFINDVPVMIAQEMELSDLESIRDEDLERSKSNHILVHESLDSKKYLTLHSGPDSEWEFGPAVVPEDSLFVMGDHRDNSSDSRIWGYVPVENILGRAMNVWLSCEEALPGLNVGCNPATIRWDRFFHSIN